MTTLKAPLSGGRYYSDGSLIYQGSVGYWWLSSPYSTYGRGVSWNSSDVYPDSYGSRAYGFDVRCIKN
jgi:hypothetical protein